MSPHRGSRAVLYVRVSTDKQVEHGHSLDAQRVALESFATEHDLDVVDIIVDGGESAGTMERPGLRRALRLLAERDAQVLVATKGDRLFRSLRDQLNVISELEEIGAAIALVDEEFDTSTPEGELMMVVRGGVAQYERKLAGQRTREGMAAARAKGVRLGRPPRGCTVRDGELVATDAAVVTLANRAAGMQGDGWSLRAIATQFNAEAIPASKGGSWHPPTVARLLKAAGASLPA